MSSSYFADVCGTPGTGVVGQSLNDCVMNAGNKGAINQYQNVLYTGNRVPGPNGSGEYNILKDRYNQPYVSVVVG